MRRALVVACAVLCALVALCGCGSRAPDGAGSGAAVLVTDGPGVTFFPVSQRKPVPDLEGRTLTGKPLSLGGISRNQILVVNVWAAWCVECRAESQALSEVERRYASRGVTFLGIDEQDNPTSARLFVARIHPAYPSFVDRDGRLLGQLAVLPSTAIPSTLIVDRNGRMAGRIVGQVHPAALSRLLDRIAMD